MWGRGTGSGIGLVQRPGPGQAHPAHVRDVAAEAVADPARRPGVHARALGLLRGLLHLGGTPRREPPQAEWPLWGRLGSPL